MLKVTDLSVRFTSGTDSVLAVDDVSFEVSPGEMVAVVGESGSGKSTTALSLIRLLESRTARVSGRVDFHGQDLLTLDEDELNRIRGKRIGMVFQEPRAALNPSKSIGRHLTEVARLHLGLDKRQAEERALQILEDVSIPDPRTAMRSFPHQLSGGMCQRVMVAMALLCEPELMIADEPTASLDPTTGMEILDLLARLRSTHGTGIVLITHNLSLAANFTDRVIVMYAGQVVESGASADVLREPQMPYTEGLLASMPGAADAGSRRLVPIEGNAMHGSQGAGCNFASRCPLVQDVCYRDRVPLVTESPHRLVRCLFPRSRRQGPGADPGRPETIATVGTQGMSA